MQGVRTSWKNSRENRTCGELNEKLLQNWQREVGSLTDVLKEVFMCQVGLS